jgi:hypothetical protein
MAPENILSPLPSKNRGIVAINRFEAAGGRLTGKEKLSQDKL